MGATTIESPQAAKAKGRGRHKPKPAVPPALTVLCRGCPDVVSVLFPVCPACVERLPAQLREELITVHERHNVVRRLTVQDRARAWFVGAGAERRVITPALAQPTALTVEGDRTWLTS